VGDGIPDNSKYDCWQIKTGTFECDEPEFDNVARGFSSYLVIRQMQEGVGFLVTVFAANLQENYQSSVMSPAIFGRKKVNCYNNF